MYLTRERLSFGIRHNGVICINIESDKYKEKDKTIPKAFQYFSLLFLNNDINLCNRKGSGDPSHRGEYSTGVLFLHLIK